MAKSEWSKNLRKLLECPVCYEIKGLIILCKSGHNICNSCILRIDKCPVCQSGFSTMRNYCAESVSLMFNSLQKDFDDIETNFKKINLSENKKSCLINNDSDSLIKLGTAVNRSWGLFPCVVKTCGFKGCFSEIVHHFENKHPKMFERILDNTLPMTKSWKMTYDNRPKSIFNCFFIENVGLFVFHININQEGFLRGLILMYASRSVAKKFSYRFEITNGKKIWNFKTRKTQTCRTPLNTVYTTCLSVTRKDISANNTEAVPLTCTVFLKQQILR